MSLYAILLAIGAIGMVAQAIMGLGHSSGGHSGGHGGHDGGHGIGHGHGHGAHDGAGHGHGHGEGHSDHGHGHDQTVNWSALTALLSPLTLFSIALGAGATGVLLEPRYPGLLLPLYAMLGGFAFYALLTKPIFRLAMGFVTTPAAALEGSVAATAVAASRFDSKGQGVVRMTIDGQTVRLLAHLDAHDLADAPSIATGDELIVTEIDATRNACRVARL